MKRILAIALTIVMCVTLANTVSAAELDTPVEPEIIDEMYASGTYTILAHNTLTVGPFYVPEHNFCYKMQACLADGGTSNSTYTVTLKKSPGGTISSATHSINNITYKYDWISVTSGNHYFTISNNSDQTIEVTLIYYSWL